MRADESEKNRNLLAAIDGWYSGTLSESGAIQLKERLRNDLQACHLFIEYGDMLVSLSLEGEATHADPVDTWMAGAHKAEESAIRQSGWRGAGIGLLLAAVGAVFVAVSLLIPSQQFAPLTLVKEEEPTLPSVAAREPVIPAAAVISEISLQSGRRVTFELVRGLVRTGGLLPGEKLLPDDELHIGEEGLFVEMTFASGVRLVLQGPAQLVVETPMSARLVSGRALGFVPPAAVGFALAVPSGLVRDQGTEFAVDAADEKTSVSVLTGMVDCELMTTDPIAKQSRLQRGEHVQFDPAAGLLVPLAMSPASLGRIVEFHEGVAGTAGDVQVFLNPAPLPSGKEMLLSDSALLYRDRKNVSLGWSRGTAEIQLTSSEGNSPVHLDRVSLQAREEFADNITIDSYLVRLKTQERKLLVVSGSITFRQEIVGVITSTAGLIATDEILASSELAADWNAHPVESRGSNESADVVDISDDGKTVSFKLQTSGAIDEMRILVRNRAAEAAVPLNEIN
ncbi:hypothetical protein SAMN05421753_101230 [Planctomicrobium piriforme]|uniref:FecR protein domain-containing protein n=2 Tax=Planctomicrobium piriforme TaxID=1576369 RepID=A0A1I3B4F2_9PLAN|nr:hypothetical protein SAMN05421753_101230 [Planctomicrobium piriforme]